MKLKTMKLEEGYIQYDATENAIRYYWPDGSSMFLNSSDFFYVWNGEAWHWSKLCWSENKGWYLSSFPMLALQTGEKIRVAVEKIF